MQSTQKGLAEAMSGWRCQVGGWPQAIHAAIQALAVLMAQELRLTPLLLCSPIVTQHTDTKADTYCIIRPLNSTSRVLSSSCDTQCHQRLKAVSCLELEHP